MLGKHVQHTINQLLFLVLTIREACPTYNKSIVVPRPDYQHAKNQKVYPQMSLGQVKVFYNHQMVRHR
ncbi:hypothetical protein KP509_1Z003700 [Ceratopteris richardii]|nr:hypothetical protein KP509_1Z003700 [Ceratopteris richardii]